MQEKRMNSSRKNTNVGQTELQLGEKRDREVLRKIQMH